MQHDFSLTYSIEVKYLIGFEAHCKFYSRTIRVQIEILH